MTDAIVLLVYLLALLLHLLIEEVLARFNIQRILSNSANVPDVLKGIVSAETHAKSTEYEVLKNKFGQIAQLYSTAWRLVFLFSGVLNWAERVVRECVPLGPLGQGVALLSLFAIVSGLVRLPVQVYSVFSVEARYGFNKTSVRTFVLDKVKGVIVGLLLGVPFLCGLLLFITRTGEFWWLWAAVFVILFQFAVMLLYPVAIAPLFNKFTPLEEGELKQRLEALARECQFAARGIFVMDGSKRSGHSNAYFTGFGRARRIVLFDTLIRQMSVSELAGVLAHEIGHYKLRHIYKFLALSVVLTVAGFFVLSLLLHWPPFYQAFGAAGPGVAMGLLLFNLILGDLIFWSGPLLNRLSRRFEYQADSYAAAHEDKAALEAALIKLHEKNLQTVVPHPAYSAYHHSHPALFERITALRAQPDRRKPPSRPDADGTRQQR